MHFVSSIIPSPPALHSISVDWWLNSKRGPMHLRSLVSGQHISVRTIEALSYLSPFNVMGMQCKVSHLSRQMSTKEDKCYL
jgi:hypothetical protein